VGKISQGFLPRKKRLKKISKKYESHMNRMSIQFYIEKPTNYIIYMYACGQCYSVSKLVILHSLKMVIFIFGLKTPHLIIYLGPEFV